MVIPCAAAAAQAAGAAGSAGATALGLGMGKTDLDLTRELFKMQMRQAKRLWTADWAEASLRHGEQCFQSAQQHSEAQAMATAAYFQAEKLASVGLKLARDQDSRAYEIAWRAEVRESLRDELANQNNRFNIIMLCDTVCLSCVFSLVAEGSTPTETATIMINVFVFFMGLSITLFTVSLWCAVIVVRRLHEHTASTLERKLFAQSEDLQQAWRLQLAENLPTGAHEMHLVNQAYVKWVDSYIDPIGKCSIHLMSMGVVAMFITAGLLTHNLYLLQYNAPSAVMIFWSMVLITSTSVLFMKFREDRKEKKKQDVYDNSWQDRSSLETGPFAKIIKAAHELFSQSAVNMGSSERVQSLDNLERSERDFCAKTKSLHRRVESLRKHSEHRSKMRKDILQLLTTAAEELDALPEELTGQLNKLLHEIDEADSRTATVVTMQSASMLNREGSSTHWARLSQAAPRAPMPPHPIDAQRIPVSLTSLRKKLGEISLTTMLRVKNLSDEPLRLKSGVQLKDGRYIKSLKADNPKSNTVCYHLYPVAEIPARSEVVMAARSGGAWVPTSGINGEIVYTNRKETWVFQIRFSNELIRSVRKCEVNATCVSDPGASDDDEDEEKESDYVKMEDVDDEYWQISRDELDRKANNEFLISIDVLRGAQARKAVSDHRHSKIALKSGFLLKNRPFGLRLQWHQRWFVLTPTEIIYSQNAASKKKTTIFLKDVTNVSKGTDDMVHRNVFEIHVGMDVGGEPIRLSAASPTDRDDWIRKISGAMGIDVVSEREDTQSSKEDVSSSSSATSYKDGIELVAGEGGTTLLPI